VTEAGEGEDGRVRSAAGIGALLSEGIGDTIRVSLSEDPEKEIPVARKIADFIPRSVSSAKPSAPVVFKVSAEKPVSLKNIRGPLVIANMSAFTAFTPEVYMEAGFTIDEPSGTFVKGSGAADVIIASFCPDEIPARANLAVPYKIWLSNSEKDNVFPLFSPETYIQTAQRSSKLNFVLTGSHFNGNLIERLDAGTCMLIFTFNPEKERYAPESLFSSLHLSNPGLPVILNPVFNENNIEDLQIKASALLGKYITDKQVTGISLINKGDIRYMDINSLCFSILQCTEARITRTMYLSCPTCGRTKFSLQDAVRKVKEKTGHLKGLKIAVMGCIVNGPGEMAGADWGYVGAAKGKVHIYKGTEPVLKNVPEENAADELLRLIEEDQASL
jgi:(E)-4-hydroxy-3-methylbut-2-enyl-diphosphate synthase